ncbi:hypothetical protein [Streptomyces sp. NPDC045470]|uniref:hypothetical protein n=1 Tax=Streptomyces sp. NPDC045470 TaxID=3155469 RepID=UPI0033CCE43D
MSATQVTLRFSYRRIVRLGPTSERGARIDGVGLAAPRPPGERLLHRLALADVGLSLEADGHTVLTEREVRTAEAAPGR